MELHQGASETASAEESPASRGALPGGLPGLHGYPLVDGLRVLYVCYMFLIFHHSPQLVVVLMVGVLNLGCTRDEVYG